MLLLPRTRMRLWLTAFVFACCSLTWTVLGDEPTSPRTAEQILREYDTIVLPEHENGPVDAEKWDKITKLRVTLMERMLELAPELYSIDPNHARVVELFKNRWKMMNGELQRADQIVADAGKYLDSPNSKLGIEASYWMLTATAKVSKLDRASTMDALNKFLDKSPKDPRGAEIMVFLASRWAGNDPAQNKLPIELLERVMRDYPDSQAAKTAQLNMKIAKALGQPFELKFKDALTDEEIDLHRKFKGKVVVVSFWATQDKACMAAMPKLKELYARYHDKGLEIVGVSLDDESSSGPAKMKEVARNAEMTWYHYYQGQGFASAFSSGWGISSIPRVFVIDADGKLYDTNAGAKLEGIVRKLLGIKEEPASLDPGAQKKN